MLVKKERAAMKKGALRFNHSNLIIHTKRNSGQKIHEENCDISGAWIKRIRGNLNPWKRYVGAKHVEHCFLSFLFQPKDLFQVEK